MENAVGNPIGNPIKNLPATLPLGTVLGNWRASSERLPPACPETFTMAEDPKLSAVGGKSVGNSVGKFLLRTLLGTLLETLFGNPI